MLISRATNERSGRGLISSLPRWIGPSHAGGVFHLAETETGRCYYTFYLLIRGGFGSD